MKSNWRRPAWLFALGAFGLLVGLVVARTEIGQLLREDASQKWQAFLWDNWYKGKIDWDEFVVTLPSNQYGWTRHESGDLFVFSRISSDHVSLLLKKGEKAKFPYLKFVNDTCKIAGRCSTFSNYDLDIGNRKANVVSYRDEGEGISVRSNAYIYVAEPPFLVLVGAEHQAGLDSAIAVSRVILGNLVSGGRR